MNKNISIALSFIAGVVVGVVATHKVAEQKYRNIADEEIDSVVERFSEMMDRHKVGDVNEQECNNSAVEEETNPKNRITMVDEYHDTIEKVGYNTISTEKVKPKNDKQKGVPKKVKVIQNSKIYIISPDEYNTLDGFDCETLYYTIDNYVVDSNYEALTDAEIKNTIDHDPMGHFGEYEDDAVHVRNEELMCDYEILRSMKTLNEIAEA